MVIQLISSFKGSSNILCVFVTIYFSYWVEDIYPVLFTFIVYFILFHFYHIIFLIISAFESLQFSPLTLLIFCRYSKCIYPILSSHYQNQDSQCQSLIRIGTSRFYFLINFSSINNLKSKKSWNVYLN